MAITRRNPIRPTRPCLRDWSLLSPETERELERRDCRSGCEYLPMDVFVDSQTIKEHFQVSAVKARWKRVRAIGAQQ